MIPEMSIYSGTKKIPSAKNVKFRNSLSEIPEYNSGINYRNWRFSAGTEFRLTGIIFISTHKIVPFQENYLHATE